MTEKCHTEQTLHSLPVPRRSLRLDDEHMIVLGCRLARRRRHLDRDGRHPTSAAGYRCAGAVHQRKSCREDRPSIVERWQYDRCESGQNFSSARRVDDTVAGTPPHVRLQSARLRIARPGATCAPLRYLARIRKSCIGARMVLVVRSGRMPETVPEDLAAVPVQPAGCGSAAVDVQYTLCKEKCD
jgi:hypothetical protein